MIHNTTELWPVWVTHQRSVCATVTPAAKRPTGRLDTSPSVIHADQYEPGLDLRKQITVQSLREDDLLIAGKLAPESIFAPIQVSQITFKLHLNWKSNHSSCQTFCLIILLHAWFTKSLQKDPYVWISCQTATHIYIAEVEPILDY